MKPLIGITADEIKNQERTWGPVMYGQNHTYTDAIIHSGGIPVILPLTTNLSVLNSLTNKLDGLLLSGGKDVNPQLYKQKPHHTTVSASELRDRTETYLLRQALATQKPVLAICRGMQLLNVVCGGSLHQDIAIEVETNIDHLSSAQAQDYAQIGHRLRVEPDSKLGEVLKLHTLKVNSLHHQAIKDLGRNLRAVGWARDGIIEAIETIDDSFVIGIQAHPESLEDKAEPHWQKLFEAFILSAGRPAELKQAVPAFSGYSTNL